MLVRDERYGTHGAVERLAVCFVLNLFKRKKESHARRPAPRVGVPHTILTPFALPSLVDPPLLPYVNLTPPPPSSGEPDLPHNPPPPNPPSQSLS